MSVYEVTTEDGSVYEVTTEDAPPAPVDNSPSWGEAAQQGGKNLLTGAAGLADMAGIALNPGKYISESLFGRPGPTLRGAVDKAIPDTVGGDAADVIKAAQEASVFPVGGPVANAVSGLGASLAGKLFPDSAAAPLVGALAGPGVAAVGGKVAKAATGAGKAFERASVGAGARSYLKSQRVQGLLEDAETGEAMTRLKQAINEIGDTEGWGAIRTPEALQERVTGKLQEYGGKIGEMAAKADANGTVPSLPFANTKKLLDGATASKGQIRKAIDEFVESFTDPKDGWDGTITGLGKWSKEIRDFAFSGEAAGPTAVSVVRKVKRTIGQDLQSAIKQAMQKAGYKAEEIETAFRKYSNYATVAPVVAEQVVKGEASTGASLLRGLLRTSGGTLTTPTIIGTVLGGATGGPIGTAAGMFLGGLGSPTGAGAAGEILKLAGTATKAGAGTVAASLPAAINAAIQESAGGTDNSKAGDKKETDDKRGSVVKQHTSLFSPTSRDSQALSSLFDPGGSNAGIAALFGGGAAKKNGADMNPKYEKVVEKVMPALFQAESGGDPEAVSKSGAKGLGQLLDSTGREWHKRLGLPGKYEPFNGEQNALISTEYYAWLLEQFKGDAKLALAAYNHGIGNVKEKMARWGKDWKSVYPRLPAETQAYVKRIARDAEIA